MKLKLECPYASYDDRMRIRCAKVNNLCANQAWKPCKGWSALTELARNCPARVEPAAKEGKTNVRKTTGKKRKS